MVNKHQQDKVKKIEQQGENINTHHMKNTKEDTGKSLSYKPMIYIGIVMVGFVGLDQYDFMETTASFLEINQKGLGHFN